ncbi:MAG TPA: FIST N-terminal domain-containing protein [Myxococcota bacterium]|jgi:small ligand-binding sensory domain FIST
MFRTGVGLSTQSDARGAGREAAEAALAAAGGAEAALLFATPTYAAELPALLAAAGEVLGARAVVGASVHGMLVAGREHEGGPAVAVLAFTGVAAEPFLIPDLAGEEALAGEQIAGLLSHAPRAEDLVIVLPDPRALRPEPLLAGLARALGEAAVVGAGAMGADSDPPLQWCGARVESGALAGLVLRGAKPPRIGVTQACRPASELFTVTRARGNWILELDGRPALEVYRETAREPLAADLRRAAAHLLIALPRDAAETLAPGSYLVRNVAGFATSENAFAIPDQLAAGSRIALAHRDPEAARDDLKAMLAGLAGGSPGGALYFDCCARGAGFLGAQDLEAAYLEQALGKAPLLGVYGSCEVGPIAGRTELLTYTGVLVLLDG